MMANGSSMVIFGSGSEDQEIHASLPPKKPRNRPGMPYPDAEVIALSPTTLMAKNRFVCEVCYKGFPREQNLELHKRGHNLPWKLKQRPSNDGVKRKVYLCPHPSCIHHDPSRALGDLTGIKKHYSRKHCDKKYKCQNCEKMYAVHSDLKAHSRTCGKKEYKCHCGTFLSRRESFISHRAFCEALAEGGLIQHPSTVGVGSSKNTDKSSYPCDCLMSASLQKLGSEIPSTHNMNLSHPIPTELFQLGQASHMIRPSTGFHFYKPSPSFFEPSADHCNINFMGTGRNNGYSRKQHSATALLPKDVLIESTSAAMFLSASSSSDPVDLGTTFEKGSYCFSNANCNEYGKNMNGLLDSYDSSILGSSISNRYDGATYEQENRNHGGRDTTSKGYDWTNENSEQQWQKQPKNMNYQQSNGETFTRDFLGVGGEIVGNISSDTQQCTFGGQSFQ